MAKQRSPGHGDRGHIEGSSGSRGGTRTFKGQLQLDFNRVIKESQQALGLNDVSLVEGAGISLRQLQILRKKTVYTNANFAVIEKLTDFLESQVSQ